MSDELDPADERALLAGFLDWYRGVAEHKLAGLTFEEATAVSTPTGLTLLGTVKHLAWVERLWFGYRFSGEQLDLGTIDDSFAVAPEDSVESVIGAYRDECDRSRRIVAEAESLETEAVYEHAHYGITSLRWILTHLIEETARHAGHLDILRELTDGRTGD